MFTDRRALNIGSFTYFPDKLLGKGANAYVFKGIKNDTQETIAIKIIQLNQINTPRKSQLLDCEIEGLKTIGHPNVVHIYSITQDADYIYIAMEYYPNGTLRDYIKKRRCLPEKEAIRLFQKIVEGYCEIMKNNFIHRDLKTENILLKSNMEPVIIDFGYCEKTKTQNQRLSYNVGSPAYMAPEAYNESRYSQKTDIWALGIILHEMVTGTIPKMWTSDVNQYFRELANQNTASVVSASHSQFFMHMLLKMLAVNENVRPTALQLKAMIQSITNLNEQKGIKDRTKSFKFSSNGQMPNGTDQSLRNKAFSTRQIGQLNQSAKLNWKKSQPGHNKRAKKQMIPSKQDRGFRKVNDGNNNHVFEATITSPSKVYALIMKPKLYTQYSPYPQSALLPKRLVQQPEIQQHSFNGPIYRQDSHLRNSLPANIRRTQSTKDFFYEKM